MSITRAISSQAFEHALFDAVIGYLTKHREDITNELHDRLSDDPGIDYSENEWYRAAEDTIYLAAAMYVNWDLELVDLADPYIEGTQKSIARWLVARIRG